MEPNHRLLLGLVITLIIFRFSVLSTKSEGFQTSTEIKIPADTSIIADHTTVRMVMDDLIPDPSIIAAKSALHIAYEHTSHGSQITTGMSGLPAFKEANGGTPGLYDWHDGPQEGALDLDDNAMASYASSAADLGYADWAEATHNYLSDPAHADVNVVMWSWCGQVGSYTAQGLIDHYLAPMTQLENDFPEVTFVYMTGHTDGRGLSGSVAINNQQIRDYCIDNHKVLFDFEDIESYNPDEVYFGEGNVTDACHYCFENGTSGNWATEWQNAHPGEWYACSSAHSEPVNANMKAYAAWWLWARLAGWGNDTISPTSSTSETGSSTSSTSEIASSSLLMIAISLLIISLSLKKDRRRNS